MSWQASPLGVIADTQLGKMLDAKKNDGEYRPYLGNDNVQWDGIDLSEVKEMVDEAIERRGKKGLFGRTKKSRMDETGRLILLEKDFEK